VANKEPIAGVLFDLDGTLVDSLGDITHALNTVLSAAGLPTHSRTSVAGMVGDGATTLVERASPDGADRQALLRGLTAHYMRDPVSRTVPFDGIIEMLAALRAGGLPLAVLSNKPHPLTSAVVAALFGDDTFAHVIGDVPEHPKKPHPGQALRLAERLGVPPAQCVMVGDSPVDVQTGQAAAMHSVAVTWGFRSAEVLAATSPDHIVHTIGALQSVLLPSPPAP